MDQFEEFDDVDDLEFGQRYLDFDSAQPDGFDDLDDADFADSFEDEDLDVRDSLDLERAYQALAEHRPDLLHPSVFNESAPQVSPYEMTQSAAGMALRVMDAREQILSSVSEFGSEARSAAMAVLSETPPQALLNPLSIDLISNYAIGEAVKRGRMGSVTGPVGASSSVSSGGSSYGGMSAFESIFGSNRFSDAEMVELRSAGF